MTRTDGGVRGSTDGGKEPVPRTHRARRSFVVPPPAAERAAPAEGPRCCPGRARLGGSLSPLARPVLFWAGLGGGSAPAEPRPRAPRARGTLRTRGRACCVGRARALRKKRPPRGGEKKTKAREREGSEKRRERKNEREKGSRCCPEAEQKSCAAVPAPCPRRRGKGRPPGFGRRRGHPASPPRGGWGLALLLARAVPRPRRRRAAMRSAAAAGARRCHAATVASVMPLPRVGAVKEPGRSGLAGRSPAGRAAAPSRAPRCRRGWRLPG